MLQLEGRESRWHGSGLLSPRGNGAPGCPVRRYLAELGAVPAERGSQTRLGTPAVSGPCGTDSSALPAPAATVTETRVGRDCRQNCPQGCAQRCR